MLKYKSFVVFFILILAGNIFSQGFNMVKKAQIKIPGQEYNDIWGYTSPEGYEYAIVGSKQFILIYDVTDCANPTLELQHADGATTIWRDFKSFGNAVYGTGDQGGASGYSQGLQVINMDNFSVSFNNTHFSRAHNLYIDTMHARLYVAGSNTVSRGLIVYDISNPTSPVHIRNVFLDVLINAPGTNMYVHDVYVKDNLVYTSNGSVNSLYVWDFTDINNIQFVSNYTGSGGYNHSSWATDDGMYIYEALELPKGMPINIYRPHADENNLVKIGDFKEPLEFPISSTNRPHNPFILEDKLYISYYEDGVQVFDISNPEVPNRIAYYDTYQGNNGSGYGSANSFNGCWGVYPFFESGCIVASDISEGFFTLELDLPEVNDDVDQLIKVECDFYQELNNFGVVLRSPRGYCFRLKVSNSGLFSLERIVCQSNSIIESYIYNGDLAITEPTKKLIAKSPLGGCYSLNLDGTNDIFSMSVACPTSSACFTKLTNTNLIIDTYTKGIIIRNQYTGVCSRLTADNAGNIITTPLPVCP